MLFYCNKMTERIDGSHNLHAGWRGESEFRDLRFSDFKPNPNDPVVFYIPEDGKTGSRRVAFFPELKPYYDAVRSAALPDQEPGNKSAMEVIGIFG